jgi:AraC-like DNA-binding protein
MRTGPGDLTHCGTRVTVPEGSFILIDNEQPYDLRFSGRTVCLTTHMEDRWLRKWVPHPKTLVARPIAGGRDWARPLAAMLLTIADRGLIGATLPRSVIADQFGAMLAMMAGEPDAQTSLYQGDLLVRLKRIMLERFDDPGLDPSAVARETGISKRHLHGIFAQSKTTFGATLMDMRLSRASQMLTDPRYRAYRVGDVAWACGFSDPSHFARRFRERYGRTPASYRLNEG